jgi:CDP-diacylglycerol--serine O-phosphatidyltransferase
LPSPAAAALVAGLVWVLHDLGFSGEEARWYACIVTIFAGATMVSNIPYWSGKEINLRRSVPFVIIAAIALAFALVGIYPAGMMFGLFLCYALSGYAVSAGRWMKQGTHAHQNSKNT